MAARRVCAPVGQSLIVALLLLRRFVILCVLKELRINVFKLHHIITSHHMEKTEAGLKSLYIR